MKWVFLILAFFVIAPVARAACDPAKKDYSGCPVSSFGTHMAGNLIENNSTTLAEKNFALIRQEAHAANPATDSLRIRATVLFSPDLAQNPSALNGIFTAARNQGIDLTISFDDMPHEKAAAAGATMAKSLTDTGMSNRTNIYLLNEANWQGKTGAQYGEVMTQFTSGCNGCRVFLTTLGGPPTEEISTQKNNFVTDFSNYVRQRDPSLFSKVTGVAFNTYGATPDDAIKDWKKDYARWEKALGAGAMNTKAIFLAEVGPPDGDPSYRWDGGTQGFLVDTAKIFAQLKATDPLFGRVEGLTWFVWMDRNGNRMVLYYVDEKTGKVVNRGTLVLSGWNLDSGGGMPLVPFETKPIQKYSDESVETCSLMEGPGENPAKSPVYRRADGTQIPQLREDANLNHGTSVRGVYCGQARSDSLVLRERVPYDLGETPSCKKVAWTGTIKINELAKDGDTFRIPFAQELADHWAGTLDVEHYKESELEDLLNNPARQTERQQKMGLLRAYLPQTVQDKLKCDFIGYVKKKGGTSKYANFAIGGTRIQDIPCPPETREERDAWATAWGEKWSMMGLLPNERTTGELKFQVCEDQQYILTQQYPEVFRLGLATNVLFQRFSPQVVQDAYYKKNARDDLIRPLTSKQIVLEQSPTGIGLVIAQAKSFIGNTIGKLLAQGCVALEPSVEVVSENPFVYALVIRRSACAPPDRLGDIYINPPKDYEAARRASGNPVGPQIRTMLGSENELRFYSSNPDTVGFLPRVSSKEELSRYTWDIQGKSLPEGYKIADLYVSFKGAVAPPPKQEAPQCKQTGDCTVFNATLKAQSGPSDTTVWSDKTKSVAIGKPGSAEVQYQFKIPEWKPNDPIPNDCSVEVVPVDYNQQTQKRQKRPCTSDTQCLDVGACKKAAGYCGTISCVREHDRVVDVYNNVPFLASIWEQAAGIGEKWSGFLNIFSVGLTGEKKTPPDSGCVVDPRVVFDKDGNYVPHPAASEVQYSFVQTGASPNEKAISVRMTKPTNPQEKVKVFFYRLAGVCNASSWVSQQELMPESLKR